MRGSALMSRSRPLALRVRGRTWSWRPAGRRRSRRWARLRRPSSIVRQERRGGTPSASSHISPAGTSGDRAARCECVRVRVVVRVQRV